MLDLPNAEPPAIIVTGTRAEEGLPAELVGGSVTLINSKQIEHRQVREVSDVLRDIPGVAVSRIPGQTQVRLRGTEGNHTLVLIDGIEATDPYFGEFDFGTLLADEGARIEVLRGQQSAIYGSDAIGGVIHYITPSGREHPGFVSRLEAGSFGTVGGAARFGGASGTVDYALTATGRRSQGTTNAREGSRDLDQAGLQLATKLGWSPTDDFRVETIFRHSITNGDFNESDLNPANPTFGMIIDSPGVRFENRASYGLLRAEGDLLDGRWSNSGTVQFTQGRRDTFNAGGRAFGNRGKRIKGSYNSTIRFGTEAVPQSLTVAVDGERESFRNADPTGFAFSDWRKLTNVGLVGEYHLAVDDRASVHAALRRDLNNRFADATTFRLDGSARFGGSTRLRAAAGSGIKNPGFFELFGFVDGRFIGNPDLKPEKSRGWEVGVEQDLASKRIQIGATYFDSRLHDEIFTTFPPPDFVASPDNRTTTSSQRGVETYLRAELSPQWHIDASYTYLHAREMGQEELRRAKHIASLAVDWRLPNDRGGLNLVARYNGRQNDDAFITPPFGVPAVRVKLDDYLLVNLGGDLKIDDRIEVFARVENLFDDEYEEVFSFVAPGRSALAGLRVRI